MRFHDLAIFVIEATSCCLLGWVNRSTFLEGDIRWRNFLQRLPLRAASQWHHSYGDPRRPRLRPPPSTRPVTAALLWATTAAAVAAAAAVSEAVAGGAAQSIVAVVA